MENAPVMLCSAILKVELSNAYLLHRVAPASIYLHLAMPQLGILPGQLVSFTLACYMLKDQADGKRHVPGKFGLVVRFG